MAVYEAPDGRVIETENELDANQLEIAFRDDMRDRIATHAEKYAIPAPLALGLAFRESSFKQTGPDGQIYKNPDSTARGIFQMTDAARQDMKIPEGADVDTEINGGLSYLRHLYDLHGQDWPTALASFKQGPESIRKNGMDKVTVPWLHGVLTHAAVEEEAAKPKPVVDPTAPAMDSPGRQFARGGAKLGGMATGAWLGSMVPPPLQLATVPLGAMGGYMAGSQGSEMLGVQAPSSLGEKTREGARIGADTAAGMIPGVGPLAFGAVDTAIEAGREYPEKGMQGVQDYLTAPSHSTIPLTQKQPFNFPGGKALQAFASATGLDVAGRGIMKAAENFVGVGRAKDYIENIVNPHVKSVNTEVNKAEGIRSNAQAARAEAELGAAEQAKNEAVTAHADETAGENYTKLIGITREDQAKKWAIDPQRLGVPDAALSEARDRIAKTTFKAQDIPREAMGTQYEQILSPHWNKPANTVNAHDDLLALNSTLAERKMLGNDFNESVLSPDINQLRADALELTSRGLPQILPRPQLPKGLGSAYNPSPGGNVPLATRPDLGDVWRMRQRAAEQIKTAKGGANKSVAHDIESAMRRSLEESGVATAQLTRLNKQYAETMQGFRGLKQAVAENYDPDKWGHDIFANAKAANRIWDATANQSPQMRADLRSAMTDYIYAHPGGVQKALQEIGGMRPGQGLSTVDNVLSRYFGKTPLGKSRVWIETDPKLVKYDTLIAENPAAAKTFQDSYEQQLKKISGEYQAKMLGAVYQIAPKLGNIGEEVLDQLRNVKGGEIERGKVASAWLDKLKFDPKVENSVAMAAIAKIPKDKYLDALLHQAHWAASIGGSEMSAGHAVGPITKGALIYSITSLPAHIVRNGFYTAIRNPKFGNSFLKAINSGRLDLLAHAVADAEVADRISKADDASKE